MIIQEQNENSIENDETFADLLKNSLPDNERMEPGQLVETEIVKITDEVTFLYIGGKSEGSLDTKELADDNGEISVKEGDTIKAYFMSSKGGELHFTTKISGEKAGYPVLLSAYENGIPVEGLIEKEIKGGYEVKIGKSRAFCPYSQMGLERESPEKYLGQNMPFKITEFSEKGRNIIVSNKAIMEEERQKLVDVLKDSLKQGDYIKGIIKSIQNFGAFVDIGGVQALVPISEISRERVEDINSVLKIGQEIEAVILNLDWDRERISLSIKETLPDPWLTAEKKYTEGSKHNGKIARLTNFGAFVTLEPGLDGLIHISDLGGGVRIKHPREVVQQGQMIEVQVNSVDIEKKRISLASLMARQEQDTIKEYTDDSSVSYKPMGNLGDLLKGKLDK